VKRFNNNLVDLRLIWVARRIFVVETSPLFSSLRDMPAEVTMTDDIDDVDALLEEPYMKVSFSRPRSPCVVSSESG
jgi:hypothetical protein